MEMSTGHVNFHGNKLSDFLGLLPWLYWSGQTNTINLRVKTDEGLHTIEQNNHHHHHRYRSGKSMTTQENNVLTALEEPVKGRLSELYCCCKTVSKSLYIYRRKKHIWNGVVDEADKVIMTSHMGSTVYTSTLCIKAMKSQVSLCIKHQWCSEGGFSEDWGFHSLTLAQVGDTGESFIDIEMGKLNYWNGANTL